MHVDEFTRLLGILVIVAAIGCGAWVVSQVAPQVQQVATLPARVEAENARIQSAGEIERARSQEQIKTLPTLTALDVQAKQAAIDGERAKTQAQIEAQRTQANASATATIQEAQARANAATVAAQGVADQARATGQGVYILAMAFAFAALGAVGFFFLREIVSARTTRQVLEIAAREGGRLELPNGHAVTFLPAQARAQIAAPRVDGPHIAGVLGTSAQGEQNQVGTSARVPIDAPENRA